MRGPMFGKRRLTARNGPNSPMKKIGSRVPFWAAAGVALLGLFFAYFFLPESLVPANRKRFRLTEGNPVGAFVVLARYPLAFAVLTVFVLANTGERLLETN